jgi:protein O-mannosyl-transferase
MRLPKAIHFPKFLANTILILAVSAILPYSNIFSNDLVGDDPDFIVKWQQIKPPADIKGLIRGDLPKAHVGTYRPLRSLYYAGSQKLFGENPIYYHILALLVHLTCTLLTYKLVRQLSQKPSIALITGLLFATHPIHTEAITFITTSFDVIGIVWAIAVLILYTKPDRSLFQYALSLLLFVAALFSYELTMTVPIILLLYHWLLDKKSLSYVLKTLSLIPFFYFVLFYFFIRVNVLTIPTRGGYIGNSITTSLYVAAKQIPIYVFESFVPLHIGLDHWIPTNAYSYNLPQYLLSGLEPIKILDLYFLSSIAFLLLLLVLIWKLRIKQPLVSFGLGFLLTSLLPVLNIFPGYLIMFEKYLYFGSIASCLVIAILIQKLSIRHFRSIPLSYLACILLISLFTIKTFARNYDWRDDTSLWERTVTQSPNNAMVWYQLGSAYQQNNEYDQAITAYLEALALEDSMYFVHTNIGISYYHIGDTQTALSHLQKATSQYEKAKEAELYLGKIFIDYQDYGSAIQHLATAQSIDPTYTEAKQLLLDAYNRLGNLLVSYSNYQEAIKIYTKALEIDSEYGPARDNLSNLQALLKP